jgi:hypothetical protein
MDRECPLIGEDRKYQPTVKTDANDHSGPAIIYTNPDGLVSCTCF